MSISGYSLVWVRRISTLCIHASQSSKRLYDDSEKKMAWTKNKNILSILMIEPKLLVKCLEHVNYLNLGLKNILILCVTQI